MGTFYALISIGGLFSLGAATQDDENSKTYMDIGKNLTNTCHESYIRTATRLGPEAFRLVLAPKFELFFRCNGCRCHSDKFLKKNTKIKLINIWSPNKQIQRRCRSQSTPLPREILHSKTGNV